MALRFVARMRGSKWQSALPTKGGLPSVSLPGQNSDMTSTTRITSGST